VALVKNTKSVEIIEQELRLIKGMFIIMIELVKITD
jgi:hypothetical protein